MAKTGVFLSWSGQRSRAVAEALKKYLPIIINDLVPWLSTKDIDKGSRSTEEIAAALVGARAGIICLTPNNLKEPWILFEAGAIAKTVREKPLACTLLIGVEVSGLSGPLAQFQATKPTKTDMLQMVMDLNKALAESAVEPSQVKETFGLCWPNLEEILKNLPSDGPEKSTERDPTDMLKELVELTRRTSLTVLDSHREIAAQIERLESMQGYANNMIPALGQSWFEAAQVLGSSGASSNERSAATKSPKRFQHASQNALRDYAIPPPPTLDDDPERK